MSRQSPKNNLAQTYYEPTITEEQFSSNLESQRKDKSQVVDAQWIFEITPSWSLNTKVEYGNYESTIESLNYDETVSSLSIKGTF